MLELIKDILPSILTSVTVSAGLTAILVWLSKEWMSARLKKSIEHEYDQKLEGHKAEQVRTTERLRSELKTQSDAAISRLQAALRDASADRNARRDYEYEARKRLYEEYEPLLFQLVELSENALHRVHSLARTARTGDLAVEGEFLNENGEFREVYGSRGWLSSPGYYMVSTVYKLLTPIAVYKLMQRRLTLVDLRLEPNIAAQYSLAKILYLTLTCDFELAEKDPVVDCTPNEKGWEEKRRLDPSKYWRQGLPLGRLDTAVEDLLKVDGETTLLKTFGEYENYIYGEQGQSTASFWSLADVFLGFHPKTRPVLWRILVTQAHVHRLILKRFGASSVSPFKEMRSNVTIRAEKRDVLDWRSKADSISDERVLVEPFSVATDYVSHHLNQLVEFTDCPSAIATSSNS